MLKEYSYTFMVWHILQSAIMESLRNSKFMASLNPYGLEISMEDSRLVDMYSDCS